MNFYSLESTFLFLLLGVGLNVGAQASLTLPKEIQTPYVFNRILPNHLEAWLPESSVFSKPEKKTSLFSPGAFPSFYNMDELAFFCRVEVQLEKKVRIPVKFRLGDIRHVDFLEGKSRGLE